MIDVLKIVGTAAAIGVGSLVAAGALYIAALVWQLRKHG